MVATNLAEEWAAGQIAMSDLNKTSDEEQTAGWPRRVVRNAISHDPIPKCHGQISWSNTEARYHDEIKDTTIYAIRDGKTTSNGFSLNNASSGLLRETHRPTVEKNSPNYKAWSSPNILA